MADNKYMDEDSSDGEVTGPRSQVMRKKGRGFTDRREATKDPYESLEPENASQGAQRSVEGYIVIATNVHEEAQEDHIFDAFGEFGEIKNLHLNLDRRTGFVKGYALVEYGTYDEAQAAISGLDGTDLLGQDISVDWAFVTGPANKNRRSNPSNRRTSNRR
eukprot:CFRG4356T1